mgnify:CR=1 FL=1
MSVGEIFDENLAITLSNDKEGREFLRLGDIGVALSTKPREDNSVPTACAEMGTNR